MFRRKYFWEDRPSSSSEDEDSENEENLRIERRQYKMLPRIGLDRWDDRDFIYRFRLSKPITLMVLSLIEDSLPCNEGRSRELRGITQLLIALRYYALGSIQLAVADFIGVSIATVHRTLKRVSQAIAKLAPRFVRMPETRMERLEAARNLYAIAKFPRTTGAIDCTHVRIQSPGGSDPELFRNRKGWFSLNVQTVAAADLKIIDIVARWQGSTHHQRIFNLSNSKQRFERGDFEHFIIIGDSGYANTRYLATHTGEICMGVRNLQKKNVRRLSRMYQMMLKIYIMNHKFVPEIVSSVRTEFGKGVFQCWQQD
ncbi:putative nuclease HARBI1 [Episyrphus balteatus]|uniref:putative nuclease HARBI1 n=1 Tax=Episyrphus balteatus TaxID=286459 RepID=UPI0024855838|nr:putative nuclease HARBI1 [Episyrphus balteatus]